MFNSVFLDVVIGLAFLFCMVSLAATSVREMIEGLLKTRAIMLERGIRELLNEGKTDSADSVTRALFDNPQIAGLFAGGYPDKLARYWTSWSAKRAPLFGNLPSYIPSRNFALAVLDHVVRGAVAPAAPNTTVIDVAAVRAAIGGVPNPTLQRILLTALDEGADDIERVRQSVEQWFNNSMDRVSGWYRRETQMILFAIGLAIAALLNINAISIGQRLLVDDTWRSSLVASAANQVPAGSTQAVPAAADAKAGGPRAPVAVPDLKSLEETLNRNGFMIGAPLAPAKPWSFTLFGLVPITICGWLMAFLAALPGYLIVAFATTLGAPFWFDLLNRLVVVRSTVKPHEKSPEEGSKDNGRAPPVKPGEPGKEPLPA
ncbi:hypothetical protein GCM10009087_03430 [Sphingomonas oligophenolica]|uniref:Uncharacterized protein n=1 Tax=Sphingomonas oligophenolica TaxID=301154 RepID=A0ABU9Y0J7_9SPHN